ncbi:LysR family transcriptional regulator [Patulibacter minatonensis]|uniref:LysR family transcriptional regulator n=1 Tax=Patulibacter minatonensis TaxID=298163 RepID=UPI00047EEAC0|nr:LysR family transcriptional regulator [Patulibacter minatonensis]
MRTDLLGAFLVVAEERHFGRAALRLHLGQSPLSQRIRRLEDDVGARLFHRSTRRVELTAAGEALLARAPAILAAHAEAADEARRAAAGELGRLQVGFTGSATFSLMPSLVATLVRRLPGVRLDLAGELLTPTQVARLTDGTLDVGLLRPPVRGDELAVEVVRSEPLVAVLPAGHPLATRGRVAVADLAGEAFIAYPYDARSVLHDAVEAACLEHGFRPEVTAEVAETATLVSFVASGLGVSLVPASVAALSIEGAVYRDLSDSAVPVELALAWRRDDPSPALARALPIIREHLSAAA